tara:strand:+ start:1853 stop:5542 length:3690 start_codon:yes stop_codon:yes gene_type:complete
MAELTLEEKQLLEEYGLPVDTEQEDSKQKDPFGLSEEEESAVRGLDFSMEDLFGGYNKDNNDITSDSSFGDVFPDTELLGKPKSEIEAEKADSLTYDAVYGEKPRDDIFTKAKAKYADIVDYFNPEKKDDPNFYQKTRNDTLKAIDDFNTQAEELYKTIPGVVNESGQKIYTRFDYDEATGETETSNIIVPAPDSGSANRILTQAGRDFLREVGGFLKDGTISGENEFRKDVPNYDLTGGEQFLSTMSSLAVPLSVAQKGLKITGKAVKLPTFVGKAYAPSALAGTAFYEAIMTTPEDEPLLFSGDRLNESMFKGTLDKGTADSIAMVMDGFVANGTFDAILGFASKATGAVGRKASNLNRFTKAVQGRLDSTRGETVSKVLFMLDPDLEDIALNQPKEFTRRVATLADKLRKDSIIELTIGNVTNNIPLDTSQTMMGVSEAYIKEVNQTALAKMSTEEAEEFVSQKAASMTSNMIALLRSQSSNEIVRNKNLVAGDKIGNTIKQASKQTIDDGVPIDDAIQSTASNLVAQNDNAIQSFVKQADDVNLQTDDILKQQGNVLNTVVADNPVVQDIVGDVLSGNTLFNVDDVAVAQRNLDTLVKDDVYNEFVKTFDEVDSLYNNLPDAEINAELFGSQLLEVVEKANEIDGTGRIAKGVLSDLFEAYQPRKVDDVKETAEEVILRISNSVRFADLYKLKADMASVIKSYSDNKGIQQRLIKLRNSITDAKDGQMAHVIDTSSKEVGDAFRNADLAYMGAKRRFSNSEPVRRLERAMQERRMFRNQDTVGEFDRGEADQIIGAKTFGNEVDADTTGVLQTQFSEMLGDNFNPDELTGAFKDAYLAQAADNMRIALANTDMSTTTNPEQLLSTAFLPVRDKLKALGAEDTLIELDKVYNDVITTYKELGDTALANQTIVKGIDEQIKAAENGILSKLVSSERGRTIGLDPSGPTKSVARSDARKVISDMMSGADSANKMQSIMDKIALLPDNEKKLAVQSLQAVSLEKIGNDIFGSSSTGIGGFTGIFKNTKQGNIVKLSSDDASNLMKSIDVIYGKDSNMSSVIQQTMAKLYDVGVPSTLKVNQSGSPTATLTQQSNEIRDSISTFILLTAGYMNPTAAMLRRLTSVPINEAEKTMQEVAKNTLALIVAEPKSFANLLDEHIRNPSLFKRGRNKSIKELIKLASTTAKFEIRVIEEDDPEGFAKVFDKDLVDMWSSIGYSAADNVSPEPVAQ